MPARTSPLAPNLICARARGNTPLICKITLALVGNTQHDHEQQADNVTQDNLMDRSSGDSASALPFVHLYAVRPVPAQVNLVGRLPLSQPAVMLADAAEMRSTGEVSDARQ